MRRATPSRQSIPGAFTPATAVRAISWRCCKSAGTARRRRRSRPAARGPRPARRKARPRHARLPPGAGRKRRFPGGGKSRGRDFSVRVFPRRRTASAGVPRNRAVRAPPGRMRPGGRPARGAGGRMRGQRGTGTFCAGASPVYGIRRAMRQCRTPDAGGPAHGRVASRRGDPGGNRRAGWAAVLADGFPLGFGKQSGGVVKNHYPKGLRNLK